MDFSIGTSLQLVLRTFPFVLLRGAVYFGIAAAYVVMTGGGAGIGYGLGALAGSSGRAAGAFWGAIGGFGLITIVLWWLREYLLYLVKAGHIAALVLHYDNRTPPAGGQIGYALGVVQSRFIEISVLFAVDRLVHGVIRALVRLANFTAMIFPGGTNVLTSIVNAVLQVAVGFVDEIILAYNIRARATDPWDGAKDALILYAQNHWKMIRNALLLSAVAYGLAFLVFLAALAPAAAFAYASPGGSSIIAILLASVFAWSVKQAILEPFIIASLMQVYFRAIDGQKPDAEWDERLEQISSHFRELKARVGTSPRRTA